MRWRFALGAVAISAVVGVAGAETGVGHLVLIGGGEKPSDAMRKFVELAGGPRAPIVAIPTASEDADAAGYYERLFRDEYGCTDVVSLDIKTRSDAARPDFVARAARSRGIFFGGGDQVRITRALLDTPVGEAIAAAHAAGAVIGGTSAGTACQSDPMITGEGDFKVIRAGAVEVVRGLGFLPGVVLDQHFIARQRANRLIVVILEHPDKLGVAIDEDTAIWVRPDRTFTVLGSRSVMVVDAAGAKVVRGSPEGGKALLGVRDLRIHVLLPGERFDLTTRQEVDGKAAAGARPAR